MTPVEFLDQQSIEFEPLLTGWLRIQCINPTHQDNHPSMGIREDTGAFNCFGCGCRGNFKQFISLVTGETPENLGYKLKTAPSRKFNREDPRIIQMGKVEDPLKVSRVREWLRDYGVLEDSFIKDFGLTYSVYSEAIAQHLLGSDDEKKSWIRFENRIITPMLKKGKVVNLEARTLLSEEERGEIKKVLYVKGGSSSYLYNWDNIDVYKPIVLVESIKNLVKVWNVTKNVVASYHAILGRDQIELLKNNRAGVIDFCDPDEAGLGKMDESGEWIRKGTVQYLSKGLGQDFKLCFDTRVHSSGKEYDANDCTLKEIEQHLKKAMLYSEYEKQKYEELGIIKSQNIEEPSFVNLPRKKIRKNL